MQITSEVAQEFVLEPDFWNASYGKTKTLHARRFAPAHVVAHLISRCIVEQAQSRLSILMRRVSRCSWFPPCIKKNKVVILIKKRISTLHPISTGESIIESKPNLKYLGLKLDWRISVSNQIEAAAQVPRCDESRQQFYLNVREISLDNIVGKILTLWYCWQMEPCLALRSGSPFCK